MNFAVSPYITKTAEYKVLVVVKSEGCRGVWPGDLLVIPCHVLFIYLFIHYLYQMQGSYV